MGRVGMRVIQSNRLLLQSDSLIQDFRVVSAILTLPSLKIGIAEAGIRVCIGRVQLNGFLEHLFRLRDALRREG